MVSNTFKAIRSSTFIFLRVGEERKKKKLATFLQHEARRSIFLSRSSIVKTTNEFQVDSSLSGGAEVSWVWIAMPRCAPPPPTLPLPIRLFSALLYSYDIGIECRVSGAVTLFSFFLLSLSLFFSLFLSMRQLRRVVECHNRTK